MGRIKTSLIKRTAKELKKIFNFDEDFEKNKILLNGIIESKRLRNMISGYITRLKKEEKQR
ncbi:MAG: 30S ribosomal protein S17e [Candidatus Pacearchaeota archaeon]